MFPHSQTVEGSIPRPGNLAWHVHVLPAWSAHRTKTRRPATGHCLPVWMSVVCLCMLNLRRWHRWLTTHKLNKSGDTEWMEFCFCYFSAATNHSRCVERRSETRRRQPLWLTSALCTTTSARSASWHTRCKWKAKQSNVGKSRNVADELAHFGTDCPRVSRLNRPADMWKYIDNLPCYISDSSLPTSWLSLLTRHISIWLYGAQRPRSWKQSGTNASSKEVPVGEQKKNKKKGVKGWRTGAGWKSSEVKGGRGGCKVASDAASWWLSGWRRGRPL